MNDKVGVRVPGAVQIAKIRADGLTLANAAGSDPEGPFAGKSPTRLITDAVEAWAKGGLPDREGLAPPGVETVLRVLGGRQTAVDSFAMRSVRLVIARDWLKEYTQACEGLPPIKVSGQIRKRASVDAYTLTAAVWIYVSGAYQVGVPDTLSVPFRVSHARRILSPTPTEGGE